MAFIVKESGESNIPLVEEGVHQAICYALYDLGTHYSEKFDKWSHQCLIAWELPDIRFTNKDGDDVPRVVSKKYTLSLGEKSNLRKDLQSWRGKVFTADELLGFDLTSILGSNCMIQIIHTSKDGKTYANIGSIIPCLKSVPTKVPENKLIKFSLDEDAPIPEGIPAWIKAIILDSKELSSADSQESSEVTPF